MRLICSSVLLIAPIETARLLLVPADVETLRIELERPTELGAALGFAVSPEWPPSPEYDSGAIKYMIALQQRDPAALEWGFRYIVRKSPEPLVIGAGGYTAPAKDGQIEIGYSISPSARRRGFAGEATGALAAHAFIHTDIARVIAHTFPHLTPSIGVLEKCGFHAAGAGKEEGTVMYVLPREDWSARS